MHGCRLGPNIVPYHNSTQVRPVPSAARSRPPCVADDHLGRLAHRQQPAFNKLPKDDVIANYMNCPITEVSNTTEILAGLRVAAAVPVVLDDGARVLAFVFNVSPLSALGPRLPAHLLASSAIY